MYGSSQNIFGRCSLRRSYVLSFHKEAKQSSFSRIKEGTPLFLRQAETARPEGPAPMISGPGTQTGLTSFLIITASSH